MYIMNVVDFTAAHIDQAAQIARRDYDNARGLVPALPAVDCLPDLMPFAENGLGAAAFEDDVMVGFLCGVPPFANAFGSTDATGVFSPMGANGVAGEDRAGIYARLYQAAGKKWARAGASSHAVCLYAHDKEAQEQFFRYGFGLRCVDAIRGMDEIQAPCIAGYDFVKLGCDKIPQILPLDHLLDAHMAECPTFILRPSDTRESLIKKVEHFGSIYFAAKHAGQIAAYIRAEIDGENFIQHTPGYLHIKGAFCLPEHRGRGLNQRLLHLLVSELKAQGYTRLGVDFESINPSAWGFWLKYFTPYTHSVVRRIDEHAIQGKY